MGQADWRAKVANARSTLSSPCRLDLVRLCPICFHARMMRFTWLWTAAYFGCQLSQCISNEITQHPHLRFRPLWTTKDSWGHFLCFGLNCIFLHLLILLQFCIYATYATCSFHEFHGFFSFGHELRLCLRVRHTVQTVQRESIKHRVEKLTQREDGSKSNSKVL